MTAATSSTIPAPIQEQLRFALSCPDLLEASQAPFALASSPSPREIAQLCQCEPHALATELGTLKSHFIGPLFETLWCHYLKHSSRYELVAHNLQLSEAGKTIGELDLIAFDHEQEQWLHQELAVKFYLHESKLDLWIGPNAIDRLDLKLAKFTQQLKLSQHPKLLNHLPQLNTSTIRREVVLKGILFHPNPKQAQATSAQLNPHHQRGRWQKHKAFISELEQQERNGEYWQVLGKAWWLIPEGSQALSALPRLNNQQLKQWLNDKNQQQRAHLLLRAKTQNTTNKDKRCVELERVMVVPQNWPQS